MDSEIKSNINATINILNTWIPMKIKYSYIPGINICIAHNGKSLFTKSFGFSDIEKQIKLNKNSLFRIASHSKMFTAVGIMQLQEQGKLKIDDCVQDYLPWFKGKNETSDIKNITIRQLLSHQSGIFRDGNSHHWSNDNFPKNIESTISPNSIVFENGTTFKYSNHAYATLGGIIEKISGEKYTNYMSKYILKPLGMKHTFPDLPDKIPSNLSNGYERIIPGKDNREIFTHSKTFAYASATGFLSNSNDIAKFLSSLSLESKTSVINRESKKEMIKSQTVTDRKNGEIGYGLGLDTESFNNKLIVGHGGGYPGFITRSRTCMEDNIQVIVLTNTNSNLASILNDAIFDLIYKINTKIFKGAEINNYYNGIYRGRWGDITISNIGSKLVSFSPETNNPLTDWSILKNTKENQFINTDKLGYGSPGEKIIFDKQKSPKSITTSSGKLIKVQ